MNPLRLFRRADPYVRYTRAELNQLSVSRAWLDAGFDIDAEFREKVQRRKRYLRERDRKRLRILAKAQALREPAEPQRQAA